MPELPELEVICEVLRARLMGQTIREVKVIPPGGILVVRDLTGAGFESQLTGSTITGIRRRGKFLLFSFQPSTDAHDKYLVINPKLSGRLQLAEAAEKRLGKTQVIFTFENDRQLRYVDQKQMGQVYLTYALEAIPDLSTLGPEPADLSIEQFCQDLKKHHGEIKGILTRGELVAGIGNAYADEILWKAQIHPFRKRSQVTAEEAGRLYESIQSTLATATVEMRARMGEKIHTEPREFMAVHMKAGQACPRCGGRISEVSANQRITNFCRTCQPGGLIQGM